MNYAQEGHGTAPPASDYPSAPGFGPAGQAEPPQQGYWDGDQNNGNWT